MRGYKAKTGLLFLLAMAGSVHAEDDKFDIQRFNFSGNTLLSSAQIEATIAPFAGRDRVFGDVQKALEAIEAAYRAAGYGAVRVVFPEQELLGGVVHLQIAELTIRRIHVEGNTVFSPANLRAALTALQVGKAPNLQQLSDNIARSNENPAKKIHLSFATNEEGDALDATIKVQDRSPHYVGTSSNNEGTEASGKWRSGMVYQYANLFDRDHVLSMAFALAPDSPKGVRHEQLSLAYRVPLYAQGASIDLLYGKSNSTTPGSTPALGGTLNLTGKGELAGLRLRKNLGRDAALTSELVASLDYQYIDSRCTSMDGVELSTAPPTPPVASCVPYTLQPLGLSYAVSSMRGQTWLEGSLGLFGNLASGPQYRNLSGRMDRYSYLTPGNRDTRDNFFLLRGAFKMRHGFANDMQLQLALSGQYARVPMLSAQLFGLAGANAVRGFDERAVVADSGLLGSLELASPEWKLHAASQMRLRLLAFCDAGLGKNRSPNDMVPETVRLASCGLGVRGGIGDGGTLRADLARIQQLDNAVSSSAETGDTRAHVSVQFGF